MQKKVAIFKIQKAFQNHLVDRMALFRRAPAKFLSNVMGYFNNPLRAFLPKWNSEIFLFTLNLLNMKKYLLGIAVIALILGVSAFTHFSNAKPAKATTLKWFVISGSILPGSNVPAANATYVGDGATPPASSIKDCKGGSYQCVSGFDPSQVNGSNQLIDNLQVPMDDSHTRN